MSQVLEERSVVSVINERRSVRSYTSERIERATINALLDAAVRAPTARDEEPWCFVVVQSPALLKQLSDIAKAKLDPADHAHVDRGGAARDEFHQAGFNLFYDAGVLIAIGSVTTGRYVSADCWLAAENLMLAAWSLGLGSCVIGSAVPGLNTPEARALLGIPPELTVVAPIVIGRARAGAAATPHRKPRIAAWLQADS